MCKYCKVSDDEDKNLIKDLYEITQQYMYISEHKGTYKIWFEDEKNEIGNCSEPINFCPMCGRKLSE